MYDSQTTAHVRSRECWLLIKATSTALLSAQHQWNKHFGWHSKQPSESHGALASTHHITVQRHHTRAASQRRNTDCVALTELLKANRVSCVCVNVTYFEMNLKETSLQPLLCLYLRQVFNGHATWLCQRDTCGPY